jgi:hypothetical protein
VFRSCTDLPFPSQMPSNRDANAPPSSYPRLLVLYSLGTHIRWLLVTLLQRPEFAAYLLPQSSKSIIWFVLHGRPKDINHTMKPRFPFPFLRIAHPSSEAAPSTIFEAYHQIFRVTFPGCLSLPEHLSAFITKQSNTSRYVGHLTPLLPLSLFHTILGVLFVDML